MTPVIRAAIARYREVWSDIRNAPDYELQEVCADLWLAARGPNVPGPVAATLRLYAWHVAGELTIRNRPKEVTP